MNRKEFDVELMACERDDAYRAAAQIANAFQDLYNEFGEVEEIQLAYKKVERLIATYSGLERVGL
jgi:hypothetical protein